MTVPRRARRRRSGSTWPAAGPMCRRSRPGRAGWWSMPRSACAPRPSVRPGTPGLRLVAPTISTPGLEVPRRRPSFDRGGPLAPPLGRVPDAPGPPVAPFRPIPRRRPAPGWAAPGALDVALVAALAAARGETLDRARDRRPGLPAGGGGGGHRRRAAGPVRRGVTAGSSASAFVIPTATVEPARARPGVRGRAGAAHAALLHRRVPVLGRHHRPGDGGLRAGRRARDRRAPLAARRSPTRWRTRWWQPTWPGSASLLSDNWACSRSWIRRCAPPRWPDWRRRCGAGALGGKAAGAGAGGCMFFLTGDDPGPAAAAAAPSACGSCRCTGRRKESACADGEELELRRAQVGDSPDLAALAGRMTERAAPVLARRPPVPAHKALLSIDGGVCPEDGATLVFDPWSPVGASLRPLRAGVPGRAARPRVGPVPAPLAGRAGGAPGRARRRGRGSGVPRRRRRRSWPTTPTSTSSYPNRDNVLGPSRLFFSTYLESIWITNYLAAASLLREAGRSTTSGLEAVSTVADEAANLIGEFDEGLSNRQTWHNAALAAIAVWFEDEELAHPRRRGADRPVGHLCDGFGDDGMWYEGENYHLFALRGLLLGARLGPYGGRRPAGRSGAGRAAGRRAPGAGADRASRPHLPGAEGLPLRRVAGAADVPGTLGGRPGPLRPTARPGSGAGSMRCMPRRRRPRPPSIPTCTKPAGRRRPGRGRGPTSPGGRCSRWRRPCRPTVALAPGVHAAGARASRSSGGGAATPRSSAGARRRSRASRPAAPDPAVPAAHWLADPGTGSYVTRDLFWYRSTLAHNAPRLDGLTQPVGRRLVRRVRHRRATGRGCAAPSAI